MLDAALPHRGLRTGAVHEWLGPAGAPPLTLLAHLASRAAEEIDKGNRMVLWIGQSVWPYPHALARGLLQRCLFVRAPDTASRLWAIDLALRSPAAAAVIADGSGLDLAATRRLQLAAEAGGALCLLARPSSERAALSAAATRWLVQPCPSPVHTRRWTVELLRCKGVQPAPGAPRSWTLEQSHAASPVAVVPDVLDRPGAAQEHAPGRRTG